MQPPPNFSLDVFRHDSIPLLFCLISHGKWTEPSPNFFPINLLKLPLSSKWPKIKFSRIEIKSKIQSASGLLRLGLVADGPLSENPIRSSHRPSKTQTVQKAACLHSEANSQRRHCDSSPRTGNFRPFFYRHEIFNVRLLVLGESSQFRFLLVQNLSPSVERETPRSARKLISSKVMKSKL